MNLNVRYCIECKKAYDVGTNYNKCVDCRTKDELKKRGRLDGWGNK